jgi:hypothetical protein
MATQEEIISFRDKESSTSVHDDEYNATTIPALFGSENDENGCYNVCITILQMLKLLGVGIIFQIVEIGSGTGEVSKKIIGNFPSDINTYVSRWIATDLCHKPNLIAYNLSQDIKYQTKLKQLNSNLEDTRRSYIKANEDLVQAQTELNTTQINLEKAKTDSSIDKCELNKLNLLFAKQTYAIKLAKEKKESCLKINKTSYEILNEFLKNFRDDLEINQVPSYIPISVAKLSCTAVLSKIRSENKPTIIFIACPTPCKNEEISYDIYTLIQAYSDPNIRYCIIVRYFDKTTSYCDGNTDFYDRIKQLEHKNMWHLVFNKKMFTYSSNTLSGYLTYKKRRILIFSRNKSDSEILYNKETGIK